MSDVFEFLGGVVSLDLWVMSSYVMGQHASEQASDSKEQELDGIRLSGSCLSVVYTTIMLSELEAKVAFIFMSITND